MSGDTTKASIWADADVYTAPLGSPLPADASAAFSAAWTLVGLLDGGDGIEESREEDKKDHYAWGGILVATTRKNFKLSKKFSVLEDNVATRALVYPGSSATQIVVPKPAPIMLAFETRTGGKVRRMITSNYAQVDVDGSIKEGEDDLTKVGLIATIFPTSAGVLFDVQGKPTITSIAITPLTLALATAGAAIKTLLATATYSDASTGNVTAQASWTSTVPAKATVSAGYVSAVAAGTTNVSCSYGGVTATAPCVVTVT